MVSEGESLAKLHKNIVVKIPMTKEGIKAIKYFHTKNIKTNCTLVFSSGQALLAAKAGATYLSPFLGRLDDISSSGIDLISQIRLIYDNYAFKTQILAASIRHPMHIINCAEIGADVITAPLKAINALANHPLTDSGLAKFLEEKAKVVIEKRREKKHKVKVYPLLAKRLNIVSLTHAKVASKKIKKEDSTTPAKTTK